MGINISVYRDAGSDYDCTNNGVSSQFTRLCVVNIKGPFDPTEDITPVILVKGPYNTARLIPLELSDGKRQVMFGGNIGVTSDSRFGEAIAKMTKVEYAPGMVKIFDRVED